MRSKWISFFIMICMIVCMFPGRILAESESGAILTDDVVQYDASTECTRALTMYILWEAFGKPDPVSTENPFQDISADSPYLKAILWAVENGIISGVSRTEFGPDEGCTKALVATWIWRTAGSPAIDVSSLQYSDVDVNSWYGQSIIFVNITGLMNPVSESVFGVYDVCKVGDLNIDKINDVFNTRYSGTCGENLQWSFNEEIGSLTITGTEDMDDYNTEIEIPWRKFKEQIVSVSLEEGITSIGKNAFSETKLQGDIILPSSVKKIGESAFYDTYFSSINIPASLEKIEKYAFRQCYNLSSIDLDPDNPYFSYDGGLYQGKTLIQFVSPSNDLHYSIKEGTEKIDEYAFSSKFNYNSVTIPDSVTEIGAGAFYLSSLRSVEIPSSVRILGERAFADTALVSISLPDSLESLPDRLFEGCNFEELTLPDSVKSVGSNMFYRCDQLKKIILPDALKTIPVNMFYNCTSLEEIVMPTSLESIGNNAFYKCSALKEIDLPNSLSTIGLSAFEDCSKLSSIKLPDTLDSIGSRAFSNCTDLTSFSIPEGVKFIDSTTFANCENLISIDIPKSVAVISSAAFYECKSLSKIDIPDTVTGIGYHAFYGCESLESVFLPSKISEIYRSVFENCTNLKVMSVPESVKIIEQRATNGCNKLTTVLYEGSKSDWNKISIQDKNDALKKAQVRYAVDLSNDSRDYVPVAGFGDVFAKDYYSEPVSWAVEKGITNGTSATSFSPDGKCTRGQIVTFLWRAMDSPEPKSTNNSFTDVKSDAYYYKAVLWAVENGITSGTSKTTFSPDNFCTRAQAVTFMYRTVGQPAVSGSNPFKDVAKGSYYYNAVLWATQNNITNGTSTDTFSPNQYCTRGQIVTFLYRGKDL